MKDKVDAYSVEDNFARRVSVLCHLLAACYLRYLLQSTGWCVEKELLLAEAWFYKGSVGKGAWSSENGWLRPLQIVPRIPMLLLILWSWQCPSGAGFLVSLCDNFFFSPVCLLHIFENWKLFVIYLLKLNAFYSIYSSIMIITTQLCSISIPNPQPIPLPPNLSPLETRRFAKSGSQ